MNGQKISIILETISFFCVTLDLYGKTRVKRSGDKVREWFDWVKKIAFTLKILTGTTGTVFYVTLLIFFLIFIIIILFYPEQFLRHSLSSEGQLTLTKFILLGFYACIIAVTFAYACTSLLWLLLLILTAGLELLADTLIVVALFLLGRWELEGVLYIIGTVIFLISKAISFCSQ